MASFGRHRGQLLLGKSRPKNGTSCRTSAPASLLRLAVRREPATAHEETHPLASAPVQPPSTCNASGKPMLASHHHQRARRSATARSHYASACLRAPSSSPTCNADGRHAGSVDRGGAKPSKMIRVVAPSRMPSSATLRRVNRGWHPSASIGRPKESGRHRRHHGNFRQELRRYWVRPPPVTREAKDQAEDCLQARKSPVSANEKRPFGHSLDKHAAHRSTGPPETDVREQAR